MIIDIQKHCEMLAGENIRIMYRGPLWANGIDGMAEMLQEQLEFDKLPLGFAQAVFSVFIEQLNNMLMHSAEKEFYPNADGKSSPTSIGMFIFGVREKSYFFRSGNLVTPKSAAILKERIDYLNTLDKKELRSYCKERSRIKNTNDESRGAGLGLIEIARRASSKIEYTFTPVKDGLSFFTMSVTI